MDPSQFETDYKNGDYVCMKCGEVDYNRVLSTEEESRTFADDTAADKEKKKRVESRKDGGLGTFIATGVERRGDLVSSSAMALQRTQLKIQEAPAELQEAAERQVQQSEGKATARAGALKSRTHPLHSQIDKVKVKVDHVRAKRQDIHESLAEDAKRLADKFAAAQIAHDKACVELRCYLRRPLPRAADACACALIVRASELSAEGPTAVRTLRELESACGDQVKAMYSFAKHLRAILNWTQGNGCGANVGVGEALVPAGPAGPAGPAAGAMDAKGLASRVLGNACGGNGALARVLEQHVFGVLDWLAREGVLEGKRTTTTAAAAIVMTYSEALELDEARARGIGEIVAVDAAYVAAALGGTPSEQTLGEVLKKVLPKRMAWRAGGAGPGAGGAVDAAARLL